MVDAPSIGFPSPLAVTLRSSSRSELAPENKPTVSSNRYSMRPSVLWNNYTGTSTRAKPRGWVACILHKTRGFLMLYVFISRRPLTRPCNINRKELYDFYYMAITLTTGYNNVYNTRSTVHCSATSIVRTCMRIGGKSTHVHVPLAFCLCFSWMLTLVTENVPGKSTRARGSWGIQSCSKLHVQTQ